MADKKDAETRETLDAKGVTLDDFAEPSQAEKDEAVRQKAKAAAADLRAGIVR